MVYYIERTSNLKKQYFFKTNTRLSFSLQQKGKNHLTNVVIFSIKFIGTYSYRYLNVVNSQICLQGVPVRLEWL